MTKPLHPSHIAILLLALALALTGCVKPRPTPTPMPTKVALRPSATATVSAASSTATPTPTPPATAQPTVEATPTATEAAQAPTAPATGEVTYQVRWGDTLSSIARAYSTTVEAIMARNPRITNASQLYAGMVLVIPAGTTTPPTGAATPAAPSGTYVVQRGDTLSSIARRFGTTVQALLEANPSLTDRNTVYAGQRLVIPAGATSPGGERTHIVQPGETLTAIARLYGTTVMAIVQRNNLPNQNAIFAGQVLVIP